MEIIHKLSSNFDSSQQKHLKRLGIEVQLGFSTFEISENDPQWPEIEPLIRKWQFVDLVKTKFTDAERDNAPYLRLQPSWLWSYPQPDSNFGYLQNTYDLLHFDPETGVGANQLYPFHIKGEPKWGKRNILQLNWVSDVFFIRPEFWEPIFKPFNISKLQVLDYKSKQELKTIIQLVPEGISEFPLNISDQIPYQKINDFRKYQPLVKGNFSSLLADSKYNYFLSQEYFGDGRSAHRAVIVSNALYRRMIDGKIQGINFIPLGD